MCTVCPVNCQMSNQSSMKFGWQIGDGVGERHSGGGGGERHSGGGGERWRRVAQRRRREEDKRAAGEWGGERRRRGSCITQFQFIILILPHFDFWGLGMLWNGSSLCCLLSPREKGTLYSRQNYLLSQTQDHYYFTWAIWIFVII